MVVTLNPYLFVYHTPPERRTSTLSGNAESANSKRGFIAVLEGADLFANCAPSVTLGGRLLALIEKAAFGKGAPLSKKWMVERWV